MEFKIILEIITLSVIIISAIIRIVMYTKNVYVKIRKAIEAITGEIIFICSIALVILYIYLEVDSSLIFIWAACALVNKVNSILGIFGYMKVAACDELFETLDSFWNALKGGEENNKEIGKIFAEIFNEFVCKMGFYRELVNEEQKDKQDQDKDE